MIPNCILNTETIIKLFIRENIFITLSKEKIPFQVNQIVSLFFFRNPIIQNKILNTKTTQ